MRLNKKCYVFDIETFKECFYALFYNIDTGEYRGFEIGRYNDDLYAFIKFIEENSSDSYFVSYNGLSFDSQVIMMILKYYHEWYGKSGVEVAGIIAEYAGKTIENSNYGLFPMYREWELFGTQIDLFKLLHFDNKNRMIGLKTVENELCFENVLENPVDFRKTGLTIEEVEIMRDYCLNDVKATYELLLVTIGDTDHPEYKDNNQIQIRLDIQEEFGIKCLNYSDSKIGDEIIKKFYCQEKGIGYMDLPKRGTFRRVVKLERCIAPYIKFETKQLQEFLERLRGQKIVGSDDFKEEIKFFGQTYTFAKGGLHNKIENKSYFSNDEYVLLDIDVSGYYVATIINNQLSPAHLDAAAFNTGYNKIYKKRLELKPLSKTDKRIKGIVAGLKAGGVSVYGKSSDPDSWLYDKQMTLSTCITGELSILMLIEQCELNGINIIMANTDGIMAYCKRDRLDLLYKLCDEWIKVTGYELEYAEFEKIWFRSVNSYLGVKKGGELKKKNEFLTSTELHKDRSNRVISLALEKYFIEGVNPEVFIKEYINTSDKAIYDYCIRAKTTGKMYFNLMYPNGENVKVGKLCRYYLTSDETKPYLIKMGIGNKDQVVRDMEAAPNDLGVKRIEYFNKYTKMDDYQIDFNQYIYETLSIISAIESSKVDKQFINRVKNIKQYFLL